jgi:histidyl-tRNA synthetase
MSVEPEDQKTPLDLFIAALGDAALRECARLARELRADGFVVELLEGKLKRAMDLANKLNARFTVMVGDDELATGQYTLKNMQTGEQQKVSPGEIKWKLQ